jgi:hypothetical protein
MLLSFCSKQFAVFCSPASFTCWSSPTAHRHDPILAKLLRRGGSARLGCARNRDRSFRFVIRISTVIAAPNFLRPRALPLAHPRQSHGGGKRRAARSVILIWWLCSKLFQPLNEGLSVDKPKASRNKRLDKRVSSYSRRKVGRGTRSSMNPWEASRSGWWSRCTTAP